MKAAPDRFSSPKILAWGSIPRGTLSILTDLPIFTAGCDSPRGVETIAGSEQDPAIRRGLTERAVVFSVHQPGERGHAALRPKPSQHLAMIRHKAVKKLEVWAGDFLSFDKHSIPLRIAMSESNSPTVVLEIEK